MNHTCTTTFFSNNQMLVYIILAFLFFLNKRSLSFVVLVYIAYLLQTICAKIDEINTTRFDKFNKDNA